MYFLGLIIPLVAVFFESYPRLINRQFGVDIWTHLLYLKEYHKQKGIPDQIKSGFLVEGTYDYPPAFISLLSKFPLKVVEKYEFLFSPIFDALHLIVIYLLVYFWTGNFLLALLTQAIYLLTPIIVIENSSATPRSLGYCLFTLVFVLLFGFSLTNNALFFVGAIFLGALIFLSHRFTTQGYLFFSIVFSIFYTNTFFVLSFFLSFLIAIVISKGFYLKVIKGHLGNLRFWRMVINYRFFHQVRGEHKKSKSNDFVFNVYNQFLKFPPFVLAITNPWVISTFIFLVVVQINTPLMNFLTLWVLTSYLLALLTIWIPKLRFLGEGQRYLELSAFPAAFIAAQLFFDLLDSTISPLVTAIYTLVGILCLVTIVVIQRKAIIKDKLRTLTPSLSLMFKYLKGLDRKPHLLCIPHQITTNTIYHTGCPVLVNADYKNIEKITDIYPFIKLPIKDIIKKYSLDYILLNEEYASISDLKIKKYKEVKRFENIVLLDVY